MAHDAVGAADAELVADLADGGAVAAALDLGADEVVDFFLAWVSSCRDQPSEQPPESVAVANGQGCNDRMQVPGSDLMGHGRSPASLSANVHKSGSARENIFRKIAVSGGDRFLQVSGAGWLRPWAGEGSVAEQGGLSCQGALAVAEQGERRRREQHEMAVGKMARRKDSGASCSSG